MRTDAGEVSGSDTQVDDVCPATRGRLIGTVVDACDDIAGRTAARRVEDLGADQCGCRSDTLERHRAAAQIDRQTRPAHGDSRYMGAVSIIVVGIGVVVGKVKARRGIDPGSVHHVIHVDSGVADADANARTVGRQSGTGDLALQRPNQRRAFRKPHHIGVIFVLFDLQDAWHLL